MKSLQRLRVISVAAVSLLVLLATVYGSQTPEKEFEEFEDFDHSNFDDRSTNIDNEWWPMKPGMQTIYEGHTIEDGEKIPHRVVFTVTDLTKVIDGIRTRIAYDTDYRDGKLEESELRFFAQDNDRNIWNMGEYREVYDENELVGGRLWAVGHLPGAKAGIIMWKDPRPGTPSYSQGYAPPPFNWTDRARVYKIDEKVEVPYGRFEDVLVTQEYSLEEPNAFQLKYYARGVGNIGIGWTGDDPTKETMDLVNKVQLSPESLAEVRAQALKLEERAYMYGTTPPAEHHSGTALKNYKPKGARISEEEAKKIAVKSVPGTVTDVAIEKKLGANRYVVEMIAADGGAETDVIIEMETGKVLATEK